MWVTTIIVSWFHVTRSWPLAVTKDLFAVVDGQSKFKLRITEGNYENPFAVKILGQVEGQVPQPRQKGELLAQVTYAFDSEQIVTVTVSDPRSNTVVARFSVNAQVNQTQEVVKEDLSELQAILLNSSHDRLLQSN